MPLYPRRAKAALASEAREIVACDLTSAVLRMARQRCRERVVYQLATRLKCENALRTIPEVAQQETEAVEPEAVGLLRQLEQATVIGQLPAPDMDMIRTALHRHLCLCLGMEIPLDANTGASK